MSNKDYTPEIAKILVDFHVPIHDVTHIYFHMEQKLTAQIMASRCDRPLFTTAIGNDRLLSFRKP